MGYHLFKVVPQGQHKAGHLLDENGRPLTHAGDFGEDAAGIWMSQGEALARCRELCLVHDEHADVHTFAAGAARYVDRDFATLRACFPVESRNDEAHFESGMISTVAIRQLEIKMRVPGWVAFGTSGASASVVSAERCLGQNFRFREQEGVMVSWNFTALLNCSSTRDPPLPHKLAQP
ncbi:unnamed protein product [Effrenium voratum]|nr:unnamed protein product [Effrenium voratum]